MAAKGLGKPGKTCFEYSIRGDTLNESGEIMFGEIRLLPLGLGENAKITVEPARGFDRGGGPGRRIESTIKGGTVGLVLDARGRPLLLPSDRNECKHSVEQWITSLNLYPEMAVVA